MDSKLKSLKVVDLRAILTQAGVSVPAKATKSDLIARITSSPAATDAYNSLYAVEKPNDTAIASAEAEHFTEDTANAAHEEPTTVLTSEVPVAEDAVASSTVEETEEEKRKRRAARFGIPVVEAKPVRTKTKITAAPAEDADKLKTRAQRFGISAQGSDRQKRPAEAELDPEEVERRRKRAERFGMPVSDKSAS